MVAAGSVVEPGTTVASGELWAGNPAKRVRQLKQEERDYLDSLPERWGGGSKNWVWGVREGRGLGGGRSKRRGGTVTAFQQGEGAACQYWTSLTAPKERGRCGALKHAVGVWLSWLGLGCHGVWMHSRGDTGKWVMASQYSNAAGKGI
jgi:hypothetical protein